MQLNLSGLNVELYQKDGVVLGCEFSDSFSIEQWETMGKRVGKVASSLNWLIGDWILQRRQLPGGIKSAGITYYDFYDYKTAGQVTGLTRSTLRHCKATAEHFPLCSREHRLSYSHHRVIAASVPKKKEKWIERAINEKLSVRKLEEAISKSKDKPTKQYFTVKRVFNLISPLFTDSELDELIGLIRSEQMRRSMKGVNYLTYYGGKKGPRPEAPPQLLKLEEKMQKENESPF